jgi:hypothetical protein
MEASMFRALRILILLVFSLTSVRHLLAQQSQMVQTANLRPSLELSWQRTSPTLRQPDGPVLYQIIFRSSATPGSIPVISPTFTLMDSHIADSGTTLTFSEPVAFSGGQNFPGVLSLGGGTMTGDITFAGGQTFPGVLSLGGGTMTGNITFALGQTFPASGLPNLAGEVTGPVGTTVVSNAVDANTANAVVRRDGSGNFSAGTVSLDGNLVLPTTTGSGLVGVITLGGAPFLHNFGPDNTNSFVGASAGNFTMAGSQNTAMGFNALFSNAAGIGNSAFGSRALNANTTGNINSAFGANALKLNTTGTTNSAFGVGALGSNVTGSNSAAFGAQALVLNTGSNNSAFGSFALGSSTTAHDNLALGFHALTNLVSGSLNIAIGDFAGQNLNGGESNNIDIGNPGMAGESDTIRLGGSQTTVFISGVNTVVASGLSVVLDSGSGKLGVVTSSRRFKQEIVDLGAESDVLMKLRPVAFYYKPEFDSSHIRQYGLVAEEVAQIAPGLVVFDKASRPESVRYQLVNAMLLNEVQKQHRLIETEQSENASQHRQLAAQEDAINAQQQHMRAMEEQMETFRRQNADMQQQMKTVMLRLAAVEKSGQQDKVQQAALTRNR